VHLFSLALTLMRMKKRDNRRTFPEVHPVASSGKGGQKGFCANCPHFLKIDEFYALPGSKFVDSRKVRFWPKNRRRKGVLSVV